MRLIHTEALQAADTLASDETYRHWNLAKTHLRAAADICPSCLTAVAARSEFAVTPDMLVTRFVSVGGLADLVGLALEYHVANHPEVMLTDAYIAGEHLVRSAAAATAAARYRSYATAAVPSEIGTAAIIFAAHMRTTDDPATCASLIEDQDWRFLSIDFPTLAKHDPLMVAATAALVGVPEALLLELHNVKPSEAILVAQRALTLTP